MSYIDCYEHEYIGQLFGLPLYLPTKDIDGGKWGSVDFSATTKNLILGGGSGEHPALVIHEPECLVARFLLKHLDWDERSREEITEEDYELLNSTAETFVQSEMLEYCGWSIAHFSDLEISAAVDFMDFVDHDATTEDYIMHAIGELIYYSIPELNSLQQEMESIVNKLSNFRPYTHTSAVSVSVPGYPVISGMKTVNSETIFRNCRTANQIQKVRELEVELSVMRKLCLKMIGNCSDSEQIKEIYDAVNNTPYYEVKYQYQAYREFADRLEKEGGKIEITQVLLDEANRLEAWYLENSSKITST